MNIEHIERLIIQRFKILGFKIQVYKSYSTNSIYIKLDYGVAHSIRISDHEGKKHLKYRYNVLIGLSKSYIENERYYYTTGDLEKLFTEVIETKRSLIDKYSESAYKEFMNKKFEENKYAKGFWQNAVEK